MEYKGHIDKTANNVDWIYAFKLKGLATIGLLGFMMIMVSKTEWFKATLLKLQALKPATENQTEFTKYIVAVTAMLGGLYILNKSAKIPLLKVIDIDVATKTLKLSVDDFKFEHVYGKASKYVTIYEDPYRVMRFDTATGPEVILFYPIGSRETPEGIVDLLEPVKKISLSV
jgi:hypothetical protein